MNQHMLPGIKKYANIEQWAVAQLADDAFITQFATNPNEDLAETALLVYGLHSNPNVIPPNVVDAIVELVAHRNKVVLSKMEQEEKQHIQPWFIHNIGPSGGH